MSFGLAAHLFAQTRRAEDEAQRVYEVVIGLVTAIDDPLRIGRVRVKFPTLSSADDSAWAPVVQPGAGKDRGWFSLPEVGDEVVCGFEHGEFGRPVVLGALWNGQDHAVDRNGGRNERRTIVSKTGSRIVLDDEARTVTLSDGGGIGALTIGEDAVTFAAHTGDIAVQCHGQLGICAGSIEIKGTTISLIGQASKVNATGNAGVKVAGNVVHLKGATVDINPGGVETAATHDGTVTGDGDDPGASGGSSGAGGASGSPGGAGESAASGPSGPGPAATAPPGNVVVEDRPPLDRHQIEIAVVDALDRPAIGVYYELTLPDGARRAGTTDGAGMIRLDDLERPGDCSLTFPDVDRQTPAAPADRDPP
jgi:hypothetical protein